MTVIFEKIIPTKDQLDKLYLLLKNRRYSISHNNLPSVKEHNEFVSKNPYIEWYILYKNKNLIGSVYLQSDNSIGINLNNPEKSDFIEIIDYIKTNHNPLPPIKTLRRGEFFVNVPADNLTLIKFLETLNKNEIQRSFVI
jgi:hypothetical protein